MLPKFKAALGMSVSLHVVVTAVALSHIKSSSGRSQPETNDRHVNVDVGSANTNAASQELLAVDVASEAQGARIESARRDVPALPVTRSTRTAAPELAKPSPPKMVERAMAKVGNDRPPPESTILLRSTQNLPEVQTASSPGTAHAGESGAVEVAPAAIEPPRASIDRQALHQAMQVAAAASDTFPSVALPPIFRVDLQEKNLDRAMARAFAWAFAVDRSYFTAAPVGHARFVVELSEAGQIGEITWFAPPAPARMKQFIQRIAQLLSANRFRVIRDDGESSLRRAYELVIVESHVPFPKSNAAVDGQVGDIWMLDAGETPRPGKPSRPAVADATGHQLRGELRLLSAESE